MSDTQRLTWISVPGDEYQAMIGTLNINLKPIDGGARVLLMDSKPGLYFRRERATLVGPMDNAMRVAERRYLV